MDCRYLEVERDEERFREFGRCPYVMGGRRDTHSFKIPRNKKAERTPPEQEMAGK
jgi:hypothetical protein